MKAFARIGVEQAEALLAEKDNVMLLDLREARDYCQGHDPRAIHLSDLNLRTLLKITPKQVHLIFCCYHGKASQDMARLFAGFGFAHCYSLDGGYEALKARPRLQRQPHSASLRQGAAAC